jgi:hypothetical protein
MTRREVHVTTYFIHVIMNPIASVCALTTPNSIAAGTYFLRMGGGGSEGESKLKGEEREKEEEEEERRNIYHSSLYLISRAVCSSESKQLSDGTQNDT